MYQALIFYHTYTRWLVLAFLLYAIWRAARGYATCAKFSKADNSIRHWTATVARIQLLIGMLLYFNSPMVKYLRTNFKEAAHNTEVVFFGIIHSMLMFTAIVVITIGSSLAKRAYTDREQFRTMLVWFSVALAIIAIAIPWPFSPLAKRPYFR